MSALIQNQIERPFTQKEHQTWQLLIESQTEILQDKATPDFLDNLRKFDLPTERIPNINEVSEKMYLCVEIR